MFGSKIPNLDIEKAIRLTSGSFAVDGMIVTQEEEDRTRRYLHGEITIEEGLAEIEAKYGLKKASEQDRQRS